MAACAPWLPGASWADAPAAEAPEAGNGDSLPPLTLTDQHDRPLVVPGAALWLLFAPDKAAADLAQAWLGTQGPDALARHRAVYVADISRMPVFVTRALALPALRELPYPVGLVRDAVQVAGTARIPRQSGALTVLRLGEGRIVAVHHVSDPAMLAAAFRHVP